MIHDDNGAVSPWQTYQQGGLPKSDVELSTLIQGMMETAGCPTLYGIQDEKWHMWDGSGRYGTQSVRFPIRMTKQCAWWCQRAFEDVWADVTERIRMNPNVLPQNRERELKKAAEAWRPHKMFVAKIWNDGGQRAIRKQISESVAEDCELFDRITGRVIADNGVIELAQVLRDGYVRLAPHDSRELVTKRLGGGVRWEPDARCPAFERFITECVQDPAQRDWLLWRTAHTLFGSQPRKGFLNMIGATHSGKSTFTGIIADLAGDYAQNVQIDTFLAKRSGDQGFREHELMGTRFVHTHEPNPGSVYDNALMKTLTGNDRQHTRTLYRGFQSWQPQLTIFIGANGPIRFNTADNAMVQREEAVLFSVGYDRMDEFLPDRMQAELPGILRLLVSYIERESRYGKPRLPESAIRLREQMATAIEPALQFVDQWVAEGRLQADPDAPAYKCAQVNTLYQHFRYWCEEAGERPVGRKTFSEIVGRKYLRKHTRGIRFSGLVIAG